MGIVSQSFISYHKCSNRNKQPSFYCLRSITIIQMQCHIPLNIHYIYCLGNFRSYKTGKFPINLNSKSFLPFAKFPIVLPWEISQPLLHFKSFFQEISQQYLLGNFLFHLSSQSLYTLLYWEGIFQLTTPPHSLFTFKFSLQKISQ